MNLVKNNLSAELRLKKEKKKENPRKKCLLLNSNVRFFPRIEFYSKFVGKYPYTVKAA